MSESTEAKFAVARAQLPLLLLALFGALCLNITYMHASVDTLKEVPQWHLAHMANQATAPLQYRVLSYIIPEMLSRTGLSIVDSYLVVRFVWLAVGLYFIGRVAELLAGERKEGLAPIAALVFAVYYAASTQNHTQPAEEPNVAFFAIGIWLLLAGKSHWWWVPLIALGALNKDTIGFLIPFLFLHGWRYAKSRGELLLVCAIVSIEFVAIYFGIRHYLGTDRPYLGGLPQAGYNRWFMQLNPINGAMWLLPSLVPLAIIAFRWKATPIAVRLFCPTLILFCIGHVLISKVDEFRTYSVLGIVTFPYMLSLLLGYRHAGAAISASPPSRPASP